MKGTCGLVSDVSKIFINICDKIPQNQHGDGHLVNQEDIEPREQTFS